MNLQLTEDERYPSQICSLCLEKFLSAEEVIMKFIESDQILKRLVGPQEPQQEVKIEVEEYVATEDNMQVEEISESFLIGDSKVEFKQAECESCFEVLDSKHKLQQHYKEHIVKNDSAAFNCSSCAKNFYSSVSFAKHTCVLRPVCHYCLEEFSTKKILMEHMVETHSTSGNEMLCNYEDCRYKSSRAYRMIYHLASHYDPQELICPHCSMFYTDWFSFKCHVNRHKKLTCSLTCDKCGSELSNKANMLRHWRTRHLNQRVFCDFSECSASFVNAELLKLHQMNYHGLESEFTCSLCDLKFVYLTALKNHEKKHLREKGFHRKMRNPLRQRTRHQCEFCAQSFSQLGNLKRHVNSVHFKIRNFVCPFDGCESAFALKSTLDVHYRQHTGLKPFQCSECHSYYSDPSTLSKHMLNVHKMKYSRKKTRNPE